MIRRTTRTKRTDTLIHYTTHFRSSQSLKGFASTFESSIATFFDLAFITKFSELSLDVQSLPDALPLGFLAADLTRSEEHTSELQSLMRISYAVFCLNNNNSFFFFFFFFSFFFFSFFFFFFFF